MASRIKRTEAGIQSAPTTPITPILTRKVDAVRPSNRNAPEDRLDVESTLVYERRLPGNAYITAHVTRLQAGFYDNDLTHGDEIDAVRFVAVHFVFHPSESINRFRAATISIGLHDDTNHAFSDPPPMPQRLSVQGSPAPRRKPKILAIAPHVIFGKVSPETLDWNFNLTGSLGVSQTPLSASLAPSGGVKGSYKLYQFLRVQGSTRTLRRNPFVESTYDIEDGEAVWTLEENPLQKSGLPREMTFVMLITKGDPVNVVLDINIEPKVASWFGHYPKFWTNIARYQPLGKDHVDLDREIGQRFLPEVPGRGFNFAALVRDFNTYVSLPGTTFSTNDRAVDVQAASVVQDVPDQNRTDTQAVTGLHARPSESLTTAAPGHNRSSSVPPQQLPRPSQAPQDVDYHIFLHNPRSINVHPTPPPPSHSAPAMQQMWDTNNPLNATDLIVRPNTTIPERTNSPGHTKTRSNTKMKRRSIEISNLGKQSLSPAHSPPSLVEYSRKFSPGSLRRRNSRTDLRDSPLIEDLNSESTEVSSLDSPELKSISLPIFKGTATSIELPTTQIAEEDILIPMQAPSPPSSTNISSPPLPSWQDLPTILRDNRLPFEFNKPIRPSMPPQRSSSSSARQGRPRGSPSPLRARREVTPSPGDEPAAFKFSPSSDQSKDPVHLTPRLALGSQRREREVSPYAATALANGVGLKESHDTAWDESKGDLKELRARKRYSVPASYSYIAAEADADRDWDER